MKDNSSHNEKIWLNAPALSNNAKSKMREALDGGWIAPNGPYSKELIGLLEEYTGKYVALISSATAGLHLALKALNIGEGDVVLTPDLSFIASLNPIRYVNATPVLIDSESETWNMCPGTTEEAIQKLIKQGRKPKAIIVVHLFGVPADMDAYLRISEEYEIPIIEDAAESFMSEVNGKPTGSLGDVGVYSFNGNKLLALSGGGAVISDDKRVIQHIHKMANQSRENAVHYQHEEIGFNYQFSDLLAALGVGEWECLREKRERKAEIDAFYRKKLETLGFQFQQVNDNALSSCWLPSVLLPVELTEYRDDLVGYLRDHNIDSRPVWKPMRQQPLNQQLEVFGGNTSAEIFRRGICLPAGVGLKNSDLERIVEVIEHFFKNL
jgi:dTDP-4-amino-4,6-dideoxygalactose transaminase